MGKSWDAFWRGVSSIFDLSGSAYERESQLPPKRRSDAEALAGDRDAVLGDRRLRKVPMATVLEAMASGPGPWGAYDLYKAVGTVKWVDLNLALSVLEQTGRIKSRRVATGDPKHPVRRVWELI